MGNRAPGTVWATRPISQYPSQYVRTTDDDRILIVNIERPDSNYLATMVVSRKDARLLAKRINQCLDATRKD